MCNQFTFHHQFGIDTWRSNLNNRQTVFFLPVDPMDKNHKDPDTIDLNAPRHAQLHAQSMEENIRTQCIGSTSILLWEKDWSSIRLDRTQSFFTKHFQLIVFRKLLGWKLEKSYTRKYTCHLGLHQRSPWNMTGWKNWVQKMLNDQKDKLCNSLKVPNRTNQIQTQIMIERGNPLSEATQEPRKVEEKRLVPRRSKHVLFMKKLLNMIERWHPLSAVTQITSQEPPKHVHLMTARVSTLKWNMIERCNPLLKHTHTENVPEGSQTRSCHESISFNVGDETIRDRMGQPVVNHDESSHEQTMLNEVNMDFRIPGLPHSVVKHAASSRVRELVKKIENHPDRHALQQDLRQNKAYNPFSAESKRMIQDVGNVELFELFETDPKTQCKACLSYWSEGIVYCTCGHLFQETVANRRFIVIYDGPSFNSRIRNQEGKTSWPQIWETSRKQRISSGP